MSVPITKIVSASNKDFMNRFPLKAFRAESLSHFRYNNYFSSYNKSCQQVCAFVHPRVFWQTLPTAADTIPPSMEVMVGPTGPMTASTLNTLPAKTSLMSDT